MKFHDFHRDNMQKVKILKSSKPMKVLDISLLIVFYRGIKLKMARTNVSTGLSECSKHSLVYYVTGSEPLVNFLPAIK